MKSAQIEQFLKDHLALTLPEHHVRQVYKYATLPGGKLFRPHLVWAILEDLNPELYSLSLHNRSAHAFLSSAVEFHHTYTLLHDDLPCMDDDQVRRGRPCTHLAYGEWQALLTGDGLLNISYQLLTRTTHHRSLELIKFFSWALGPKGLIHGQVMDLSHEMIQSFSATLRTHELKTARLIQVAVLGSAILASSGASFEREKRLWRFSRLLGINFQLIDDLSELVEQELNTHEKEVNPWLRFPKETYQQTLENLECFENLAQSLNLKVTNSIVQDYYFKIVEEIEGNLDSVKKHLGKDLDLSPMILLLKRFS